MSKQPKFHIYEDHEGDWRWRLTSANGRIIADSAEGYTSKAGAKRAVTSTMNMVWRIAEHSGVPQ